MWTQPQKARFVHIQKKSGAIRASKAVSLETSFPAPISFAAWGLSLDSKVETWWPCQDEDDVDDDD